MSPPARFEPPSTRLVKRLFSNYYRGARLQLPPDIEKREFAFQYLGSHTYHRHLSFKEEKSLRHHLVDRAPAHSYYSSALFLFPEIPSMEEKKWLGSDLIFDIDADDIPGCGARPRGMVCRSCGHSFKAAGVSKCPKCGSGDLVAVETVDRECMLRALENLENLIEVLKGQFGFKNTRAFFSGNRGYHLHVECDPRCRSMGSEERREIVDYLKGVGLDLTIVLNLGGGAKRPRGDMLVPQPGEPGWRGRIGMAIKRAHGPLPPLATLSQLEEVAGGRVEWEDYVEKARVFVDEKVTIDLHRLVRIPASLNGKTGLPVVEVDLGKASSEEDLLPTCDWSPFREEKLILKLKHDLPGATRVFDRVIEGRRGQMMRLDGCLGVYLLLKDLAEPAPQSI